MKLGDIVRYQDSTWIVRHYDPRRTRTAQLLQADGRAEEVPHDLEAPELIVVANPSENWPFIMVPERPRWGQVRTVNRVSLTGLVPLILLEDWVMADPLRPGGALFLRPDINLRIGDQLHVQFSNNFATMVAITPSFATVKDRKIRAAKKAEEVSLTGLERLLKPDEDIG